MGIQNEPTSTTDFIYLVITPFPLCIFHGDCKLLRAKPSYRTTTQHNHAEGPRFYSWLGETFWIQTAIAAISKKPSWCFILHAKCIRNRLFERSVLSTGGWKQSVPLTNTNWDCFTIGEDILGNGFMLRLAHLFYVILSRPLPSHCNSWIHG